MLVLSRKVMEAITIGDRIKIVVVDVQRNRVRLGIEAPLEDAVRQALVSEGLNASVAVETQGQENCPTP